MVKKILYASSLCSKNKYRKLFNHCENKPGQPAQKYHHLVTEGIINNNCTVTAVTALPINRSNYGKYIVIEEGESENGVAYHYASVFNVPIVKNFSVFLESFFFSLKFFFQNRDAALVCDVLNISVASGALAAAKLLKKKNIGIVTDVPDLLIDFSKKDRFRDRYKRKVNNKVIEKFDAYIFLTEQMNPLLNSANKPFVVIEGQVDINMENTTNTLLNKYNPRVIMYTGAIQSNYGLEYMIDAFIDANIPNTELHLYGNCTEENLLKKINSNMKIKYFGSKDNDIVVEAQLKATLLVNPRFSNQEFTKYSFPSKNMEYMVSGTPVLTTNLPGMPEEYKKYLFLISHENAHDLAFQFKEILNMSETTLHEIGEKCKKFVLANKNNKIQSQKILKILSEDQ